MERRTTRRQPVEIQAVLSTLQESGGETRKGPPISVTVEEISGRGARVRLPQPLRPGTLVQLETGEDLLLGEVVHCQGEQGQFSAGLEIDCVLHAAAGVRTLMQALLDESGARSGGNAPQAHIQRHDEHRRQCRQQNPA